MRRCGWLRSSSSTAVEGCFVGSGVTVVPAEVWLVSRRLLLLWRRECLVMVKLKSANWTFATFSSHVPVVSSPWKQQRIRHQANQKHSKAHCNYVMWSLPKCLSSHFSTHNVMNTDVFYGKERGELSVHFLPSPSIKTILKNWNHVVLANYIRILGWVKFWYIPNSRMIS